MATPKIIDDVSVIKTAYSYTDNDEGSIVTDTVAAIVSAILSLFFVVLVVCIIRAIQRRRQDLQSRRLGDPIIQTVASETVGGHLPAIRHVLTASSLSRENVTTSRGQRSHLNLPSSSGTSSETLSDTSFSSPSQSSDGLIHQRPSTSNWPTQTTNEVLQTLHPSSKSEISQSTLALYRKTESVTDYHFRGGNTFDEEPHSGASQGTILKPS